MKKVAILFFLAFFTTISSNAQKDADSLWANWINTKNHDTIRSYSLEKFIWKKLILTNPDSSLKLGFVELQFANRIKDEKWRSYALNTIGISYLYLGKYDSATYYQLKSIDIKLKLKMWDKVTNSYNNLGSIQHQMGNYDEALEYYNKALEIRRKQNDSIKISGSLSNIGLVYSEKGAYNKALDNYYEALKYTSGKNINSIYNNIGIILEKLGSGDKALSYYQKSIALSKSLGDEIALSDCYNNLGNYYSDKNDYSEAEKYFNLSLALRIKHGNKNGLASTLSNIGALNYKLKKIDKSLEYYNKALPIAIEIGDKKEISINKIQIGVIYNELKDYKKAAVNCKEGLKIAEEDSLLDEELAACECLYNNYKKTSNISEALIYLERYMKIKNTTTSNEFKKEILEKDLKFEYDKKAAADSVAHVKSTEIQNIQLQKQEAEIKVKKNQQYALYGGLFLVLLFAVSMFNRFKVTQKQKVIIEIKEKETQQQKHLIEEKHKEITDSINYAERIQRSFLASKETLDRSFKDYFVLFKPKDIVSGDFYWASHLKNGNFALVTADSTGHGVPGAIMSIVNISCLKEAVIQGIVDPSLILNETRKLVIENLKNDGSIDGGKDGMDCSLLSFDFKNSKLHCSAANNPIWIIKGLELIEFKLDRMPVGKHDNDSQSFTLKTIDFQKGDVIYTLTDGFSDQFGGEGGKKFKSKKLQDLLVSICNDPMADQKQKLDEIFEEWRGNLEQVDDVTIIGIRI